VYTSQGFYKPDGLVDGEEAFTYFVHPDGLRRRLGC
jgi:hypothetical protein